MKNIKDFFASLFTRNKLICILAIFLLLTAMLELPEKRYILQDGAINEETGSLCVMGRSGSESVLYVFSSNGELLFKYSFFVKTGREQFNRVWSENGLFYLYSYKNETIYSINELGEVKESQKLSANDYWKERDAWQNWTKKGNVYSYENNGIVYKYDNSNYFALKFTKKNRELILTSSDGEKKELWNSSLRNEEFKDFPVKILSQKTGDGSLS